MLAHQLIDVRNEAGRILTAVDKALADAPEAMTAEQRGRLDSAAADLKAKMDGDDPDAIYDAMTALNDAAEPLTQAQMDEVLDKTVKGKKLDEL